MNDRTEVLEAAAIRRAQRLADPPLKLRPTPTGERHDARTSVLWYEDREEGQ